jgi:hypothetical protein
MRTSIVVVGPIRTARMWSGDGGVEEAGRVVRELRLAMVSGHGVIVT